MKSTMTETVASFIVFIVLAVCQFVKHFVYDYIINNDNICYSVLLPELNCMRDLMRYYRRRFRYFINLTGQEFPLRTNLELIRIARIFNGSNDIAGSAARWSRHSELCLCNQLSDCLR